MNKTQTNERTDATDDVTFRLYEMATGDDDARLCRDIPDDQCRAQPKSFVAQTIALSLSKTGDALADSKVVLPWLLGAVGAPGYLVGFLVPIRESLALLPALFIGGILRRFQVRKGFWSASSLVQGLCIIAMGLVALSDLSGTAAGWTIIGLLTAFSLARGVASIAAKDTLGKTVSKGRRGRVNGFAGSISGFAAVAVGAYFLLTPEGARPEWLLPAMIVAAGIFWILAAASFYATEEYPGATEGGQSIFDVIGEQLDILKTDSELRMFLYARTLMISTGLVAPMYVALAQSRTDGALDNLGTLILASGLASAISSTIWGRLSDKSSRATMATAAAIAGGLGLGVCAIEWAGAARIDHILVFGGILFVLGVAHAGVRIGRKTHIVDLAGDDKAIYVALSNTLIGVLLLALGAISGLIVNFGLLPAIAALSILSLLGTTLAMRMKNVQD